MKLPKFVDSSSLTAPPAGEAVPVAVRHSFDGNGWLYADQGNGSDWLSRAMAYPDAEKLYAHPPQPSETVSEAATVILRSDELTAAIETAAECNGLSLIDVSVSVASALRALKGESHD